VVLGNTIRAIAGNDIQALLQIAADLVDAGQDLENFLRRLLGQFRNLLVLKSGVSDPALLGVPESLVADLRTQSELFSREDLLRLFEAFLRIEEDLKRGTQKRFLLEVGLIELAHVSRMRALEDLIADFQRMVEPDVPAGSPVRPATGTAVQAPPMADPGSSASRPPAAGSPPPARRRTAPEPSPPPAGEPTREIELPDRPQDGESPHGLLLRIASVVQKESLESLMHSLSGAEVQGDVVTLGPGSSTEFSRRQIRENLALISEAASRVLGQPVKVRLGTTAGRSKNSAPAPQPPPPAAVKMDPLERAKREPVVRSFLDVFPGPIKAEDMEK
jgi:DNA polymerase III gamma/tau subunit